MKNIIEKYKNMSFSEAAEDIGRRFKNKDTDLIEKNSYNQELEELAKYQEKKRVVSQMKDAVKQFKKGGTLPQYGNGTPQSGLANLALMLNQGLQGGQNLSQGLIGMNTDYQSSNYLTPTPDLLPQTLSVPTPTLQTKLNPALFQVGGNNKVSTEPTTPRTTGETSAYTPALIGQGISTALNLGILAGGYDKVAPVDNPYESQVIRNMASRGIDTTQQRNQILSAYNAAKDNLSNTRSANVRNALNVNMMNVTQDNLAESKLQEQGMNNQYKGDYANVLNNLGQQKVQAQTYAEDMTARNKGQFQSNLSAFGASMADNSKFFTTSKLNDIQNKLMGDILNSKYSNVGLNKDVVARLSEGKLTPDDITVLKTAYGEEAATQLIKKFGE